MNYYIDFDNTLYETPKLVYYMLDVLSKKIAEKGNLNYSDIKKELENKFNSTTDNIYVLIEELAIKYDINEEVLKKEIDNVISNGKSFIFDDSWVFLDNLKKEKNKLFLLTYTPKGNQEYQLKKIIGSGIAKYFNGIIITAELKYELELDYSNGIFIDDNPRDLNGLCSKNPIKVIRIRRKNNKYSKVEIENSNIKVYESLVEIE